MAGGRLLTHWDRVTYTCVSQLFGSDTGLSPGLCQAIIETIAEILSIGPLGINFSGILIKFYCIFIQKLRLKVSSEKNAAILFRPQCAKRYR